jgi:photosystem II stability/assembly factor-like uncharacterized protein
MKGKTAVALCLTVVMVALALLPGQRPHASAPANGESPDPLVASSTPPPASELAWVRTGGPPGGLGYDIRYNFADPNTWYVTDNFAGVHISTDNGRTWQPANTGIPPQAGPTGDAIPIFCLTVDPHNPQILWAGTTATGRIYRSTDGGQTWQRRDNGVTIEYEGGLTFRGFTVDPRSSDIVYAMGETSDPITGFAVWGFGTGGVVYKTTDGGENWEEIWDGGIPSSLARYCWIDPRDPDVLYISTGIFDRGAVGEGDPETDLEPFGGVGILKSVDGGETWRVLDKSNGLGMLYIGSLYMHPEDPDVLLAAAGHVVTPIAAEHMQQSGYSPAGIYRTSDGGEHWTQVVAPARERIAEVFTSVEICPSHPNIAYAGSDVSIYRSEDAGETWALVSGESQAWGPPGVMAGWPIDMQCDPRDPNRIFANNYDGGNFLSEDGGRTWQNASQGYTGAQVLGVAVVPSNPAQVYAAARSGLWRSARAGDTWSGLHHPPPHDPPITGIEWATVAVHPLEPAHVLVGHSSSLLMESTDGGTTWQLRWDLEGSGASGVVSAIVFAPSNPLTVYASIADDQCFRLHEPCLSGGGYGVIVSHDGGSTWGRAWETSRGNTPVLSLDVDPTDAQTLYAAADPGLFKTSDGGTRWTLLEIDGVPTGTMVRTVAVSPVNRQRVLAGAEGWGMYASSDGGDTWQASYAGLEPNSSLDDIVFDPTNAQVVYCSDFRSGVYRSTDSGATWTKINQGLRNRTATDLSISADGQHLYVATDGEGVFRLDVSGAAPAAPYAVYLPLIVKRMG